MSLCKCFAVLCGLALLLLAACTAQPPADLPPAPTPALRPYQTATVSPTSTPPLQPVETPLPTATPFTYTVQAGDTLGGIADRFRVRLDVLQAANPGISPNSMSVGTVLNIPSDPGNPEIEPSPTPVGAPIRQVTCHPSLEAGMWCFVLVENDGADPIENLAAQVTLYSPAGEAFASQPALSMLNVLPPGASLPLIVFFPPVIPSDVQPRVQLLTATRLLAEDARYLPAALENTLVSVDWSGQTAQVSGKVRLPADAAGPAGQVWVAAAAYAADGRVVGVRRWESAAETAPGSRLDFAFTVSSLGPSIARVELFVEARPK
jgi:LysM repeat protein